MFNLRRLLLFWTMRLTDRCEKNLHWGKISSCIFFFHEELASKEFGRQSVIRDCAIFMSGGGGGAEKLGLLRVISLSAPRPIKASLALTPILITSKMWSKLYSHLRVACVASVSVWFRSKERPVLAAWEMKREPKNERGGRGRGKKETFFPTPLPALLLAPFFAQSSTLVPRSLLLNPTETLAT